MKTSLLFTIGITACLGLTPVLAKGGHGGHSPAPAPAPAATAPATTAPSGVNCSEKKVECKKDKK